MAHNIPLHKIIISTHSEGYMLRHLLADTNYIPSILPSTPERIMHICFATFLATSSSLYCDLPRNPKTPCCFLFLRDFGIHSKEHTQLHIQPLAFFTVWSASPPLIHSSSPPLHTHLRITDFGRLLQLLGRFWTSFCSVIDALSSNF